MRTELVLSPRFIGNGRLGAIVQRGRVAQLPRRYNVDCGLVEGRYGRRERRASFAAREGTWSHGDGGSWISMRWGSGGRAGN